jgi:hypothetical protein
MLKQILNLEGAQQLSKKEQNAINGGGSGSCGYETESLCDMHCPSYPWDCVSIACGPYGPPPSQTEYGWECVDTSNPT